MDVPDMWNNSFELLLSGDMVTQVLVSHLRSFSTQNLYFHRKNSGTGNYTSSTNSSIEGNVFSNKPLRCKCAPCFLVFATSSLWYTNWLGLPTNVLNSGRRIVQKSIIEQSEEIISVRVLNFCTTFAWYRPLPLVWFSCNFHFMLVWWSQIFSPLSSFCVCCTRAFMGSYSKKVVCTIWHCWETMFRRPWLFLYWAHWQKPHTTLKEHEKNSSCVVDDVAIVVWQWTVPMAALAEQQTWQL